MVLDLDLSGMTQAVKIRKTWQIRDDTSVSVSLSRGGDVTASDETHHPTQRRRPESPPGLLTRPPSAHAHPPLQLTLGVDHDMGTHDNKPRFTLSRRLEVPKIGDVTAELCDDRAVFVRTVGLSGERGGVDLEVKAGAKWSSVRGGIVPEVSLKVDNIRPKEVLWGLGASVLALGRPLHVDREIGVLKRADGTTSAELEVVGHAQRKGAKVNATLREANVVLHL